MLAFILRCYVFCKLIKKKNEKKLFKKKKKEIIGTFYGKELQKTNQKEFRIEKVLKKKGNKLYVKWKGYDISFNSWIDKKDLV